MKNLIIYNKFKDFINDERYKNILNLGRAIR